MRTMFDAVTPSNIPRDAQMVAGYVDGRFAWTDADWGLFPNAVKVRIAVFSWTNDGHVGDCEAGDMSPSEAVNWVRMRRAAGVDPTVYCSAAAWDSVKAAFNAAGEPWPHWWIAAYPGIGAALYDGSVAHQYANNNYYDTSVVADFWPGVDGDIMATLDSEDLANIANAVVNKTLGSAGYWSQQTVGGCLITMWGAMFGNYSATQGLDDKSVIGMLNQATRQIPSGVAGSTYTADGAQYAANSDAYGYNLTDAVATFAAKLDALTGAVSDDQAALLAAIQGVQTGQVDVPALAQALAPALVPLLPPETTADEVADAVKAAFASALGDAA